MKCITSRNVFKILIITTIALYVSTPPDDVYSQDRPSAAPMLPLERINPTPYLTDPFISIFGSQTPKNRIEAGLYIHYSHQPLRLFISQMESTQQVPIANRLVVSPIFNYMFPYGFSVSLTWPIIYQTYDDLDSIIYFGTPDTFNVGRPRLHVRWTYEDLPDWGLGVVASFDISEGGVPLIRSSPGMSFSALADYKIDSDWMVASNLGVLIQQNEISIDVDQGTELSMSVGLLYTILDEWNLDVGIIGHFSTSTSFNSNERLIQGLLQFSGSLWPDGANITVAGNGAGLALGGYSVPNGQLMIKSGYAWSLEEEPTPPLACGGKDEECCEGRACDAPNMCDGSNMCRHCGGAGEICCGESACEEGCICDDRGLCLPEDTSVPFRVASKVIQSSNCAPFQITFEDHSTGIDISRNWSLDGQNLSAEPNGFVDISWEPERGHDSYEITLKLEVSSQGHRKEQIYIFRVDPCKTHELLDSVFYDPSAITPRSNLLQDPDKVLKFSKLPNARILVVGHSDRCNKLESQKSFPRWLTGERARGVKTSLDKMNLSVSINDPLSYEDKLGDLRCSCDPATYPQDEYCKRDRRVDIFVCWGDEPCPPSDETTYPDVVLESP